MPKSCVKVPKGDEKERAAVNPATLCYFKHHDFTLVCSEAAQMGCINFCYYRKIRRLRLEEASFSCLLWSEAVQSIQYELLEASLVCIVL